MKIYVAGPDFWRPIPGYEGLYEISGHGEVRSLDRYDALGRFRAGQAIKAHVRGTHYYSLKLAKDGVKTGHDTHVLVLRAFKGERPESMEACHRNDVPTDNRILNLYWGTKSQNMKDSYRNGNSKLENNPSVKKTHCPAGHSYSGDNLKLNSDGRRTCNLCRREQYRAYYHRTKAKNPQPEG